jgi:predicted nucleotidyltransferase component of viral defense system
MIPNSEIREKAREYSVPLSTIERDYAQNWLLAYLAPIRMALKGGTGIRKVFIENYRFSDDLDFTLLEPMDKGTLYAAIQKSVIQVRDESGIQFEDEVDIFQTESGFQYKAKFRIMSPIATAPINIKLDITSPMNEQILLPVQQKPIFHHFSDHLEVLVTSYALEEIMAEKIRSLFQRTHPRDLYDIWQLSGHVDHDQVRSILPLKCAYKKVIPNTSLILAKKDQFEAAWDPTFRHQMKTIPSFQEAYERMEEVIGFYLG